MGLPSLEVGKNDGSVKGKSYFKCEPECPDISAAVRIDFSWVAVTLKL